MKSNIKKISARQKTLVKEIIAWRNVYKLFGYNSKQIAMDVLCIAPHTLTNLCTSYYVPAVSRLNLYIVSLKVFYEENLKEKKLK